MAGAPAASEALRDPCASIVNTLHCKSSRCVPLAVADAVKTLVSNCDVVIVVGSQTSSNSNRLREIAEKAGIPGYLVDGPADLEQGWFEGKRCVGVTAGASAPELLVQRVVARLREWGGEGAEEVVGREENVVFALPRELRPKPTAPTGD